MPIVTEHSEPKKRRAPWWVLVFLFVGLLPVVLVAWSLFFPLEIPAGSYVVYMSRETDFAVPDYAYFARDSRAWYVAVDIPFDLGTYWITYTQPESN